MIWCIGLIKQSTLTFLKNNAECSVFHTNFIRIFIDLLFRNQYYLVLILNESPAYCMHYIKWFSPLPGIAQLLGDFFMTQAGLGKNGRPLFLSVSEATFPD
jgi:hypothetical protein